MKRGEIWTVAGGSGYIGKPRPAVIVQNDLFDLMQSITICPFTREEEPSPLIRILVAPTDANGLDVPSYLMVDKLTTTSKAKLGRRVGALEGDDVVRMDRAISLFLGLGGSAVSG